MSSRLGGAADFGNGSRASLSAIDGCPLTSAMPRLRASWFRRDAIFATGQEPTPLGTMSVRITRQMERAYLPTTVSESNL
jgi:hypothetical protein